MSSGNSEPERDQTNTSTANTRRLLAEGVGAVALVGVVVFGALTLANRPKGAAPGQAEVVSTVVAPSQPVRRVEPADFLAIWELSLDAVASSGLTGTLDQLQIDPAEPIDLSLVQGGGNVLSSGEVLNHQQRAAQEVAELISDPSPRYEIYETPDLTPDEGNGANDCFRAVATEPSSLLEWGQTSVWCFAPESGALQSETIWRASRVLRFRAN